MNSTVRWYGGRVFRRGLAAVATILVAFLAVRFWALSAIVEMLVERHVNLIGHISTPEFVALIERRAELVTAVDLGLPLHAQFLDYAAGVGVVFLPAAVIAVAGLALAAVWGRQASGGARRPSFGRQCRRP